MTFFITVIMYNQLFFQTVFTSTIDPSVIVVSKPL